MDVSSSKLALQPFCSLTYTSHKPSESATRSHPKQPVSSIASPPSVASTPQPSPTALSSRLKHSQKTSSESRWLQPPPCPRSVFGGKRAPRTLIDELTHVETLLPAGRKPGEPGQPRHTQHKHQRQHQRQHPRQHQHHPSGNDRSNSSGGASISGGGGGASGGGKWQWRWFGRTFFFGSRAAPCIARRLRGVVFARYLPAASWPPAPTGS